MRLNISPSARKNKSHQDPEYAGYLRPERHTDPSTHDSRPCINERYKRLVVLINPAQRVVRHAPSLNILPAMAR
jgi:hypothetical protein